MYGKFQEHLQAELKSIKDAGLYKNERLIEGPSRLPSRLPVRKYLTCANNYLGLSNHPRLIQAAKDMMDRRGYGMSSVRFICGTQDVLKNWKLPSANSSRLKIPFSTQLVSTPTVVCSNRC